jgi:hypothetical protein
MMINFKSNDDFKSRIDFINDKKKIVKIVCNITHLDGLGLDKQLQFRCRKFFNGLDPFNFIFSL